MLRALDYVYTVKFIFTFFFVFTTINDKATLQDQTNISLQKDMFEDGFPFPKVGYVSSLEST